MKKLLVILMAFMLLFTACGGAETPSNEETQQQPESPETPISYEFTSEVSTITSRDVEVPITVVMPTAQSDTDRFPLVIMAHGHGGVRDVAGGFVRIAEGLASEGIASIRMDFSGCGDSQEGFADNNLSNMLADIQAAEEYMSAIDTIDLENVGVLGYSMGGRATILSIPKSDYKAVATWAPAATDGESSMFPFMGGEEAYQALRAEAEKNGSAMFTTRWGQEQELGFQWFADLEETKPIEAIKDFKGPILIVHGAKDDIVLPEVCQAAADAAQNSSNVTLHTIDSADHGLGLYSGETDITDEVDEITINFLVENLK